MPIIGTAAWSIPGPVRDRFPGEGSGLARYAAVFKGVEINSTFYKRHQEKTFERWAASVPSDFRFAVKMPREISHRNRLEDIDGAFETFLGDIQPLEGKLGPLLCQLPPSMVFDPIAIKTAFATMRARYGGQIVIEVRHKSWACSEAMALLDKYSIDPVLADPAVVWTAGELPPPRYVRLHGKPKVYYSRYSQDDILSVLSSLTADSWCIFDNTASGAAAPNALFMWDHVSKEV